jgi:cell shape-determining protein MreC
LLLKNQDLTHVLDDELSKYKSLKAENERLTNDLALADQK